MAYWRTSGNISETRKDRGKVTMTAYRQSPMLCRTVPSPTPYSLPFPKIWGSQLPPLKTAITNFGQPSADRGIIRMERLEELTKALSGGTIGTKAHKILEKVGLAVGVVRESPKFSGHPYMGCIARSSLRSHSFLVLYFLPPPSSR